MLMICSKMTNWIQKNNDWKMRRRIRRSQLTKDKWSIPTNLEDQYHLSEVFSIIGGMIYNSENIKKVKRGCSKMKKVMIRILLEKINLCNSNRTRIVWGNIKSLTITPFTISMQILIAVSLWTTISREWLRTIGRRTWFCEPNSTLRNSSSIIIKLIAISILPYRIIGQDRYTIYKVTGRLLIDLRRPSRPASIVVL